MDENKELWNKAAAFHGHVCPGLTIGYKAALYAIELLKLTFSEDERVVCVSENDACGVDAIQVILGCSVGKGNLLFHMTGKQAFNFYNRTTGRSVRVILKDDTRVMTRDEKFEYYQQSEPRDMFDVTAVKVQLPEHARLFKSYKCDRCGESTGANWIHLFGEEKLCPDCFEAYDRFKV